jgi:hypothetical protein
VSEVPSVIAPKKGEAMSSALRPGGRVRVRVGHHPHGYHAGDKGIVPRVATPMATDINHELLAMDKDGPEATRVLFNTDEIGPDV